MKRKMSFLAIAIVALALTQTAAAQMMGGGHHGGGPGYGGYGGGYCGHGGPGMGGGYWGMGSGSMGMGPFGGEYGAGSLLVTPGGTTLVVSSIWDTASGAFTSARLRAIGPNGENAWTWNAGGLIYDIAAAGDLVVVAVGDPGAYGSTQPGYGQGALVALRASAGTEAWRLTIDGLPVRLQPASNFILALVAQITTSTTGGGYGGHMGFGDATTWGMRRILGAVDLGGKVLWSIPLDQ